mmetsp:Transcript_36489/g.44155  ORF Transcript_36489/g.44155 Transcript_36489/m.44155 type:complete len:201 (-) Transcript_36489:169-771(-)
MFSHYFISMRTTLTSSLRSAKVEESAFTFNNMRSLAPASSPSLLWVVSQRISASSAFSSSALTRLSCISDCLFPSLNRLTFRCTLCCKTSRVVSAFSSNAFVLASSSFVLSKREVSSFEYSLSLFTFFSISFFCASSLMSFSSYLPALSSSSPRASFILSSVSDLNPSTIALALLMVSSIFRSKPFFSALCCCSSDSNRS